MNYVLHAPSVTDRALIRTAIDDAIAVLPLVVSGESGRAMNRLHRRRDDNAKPE